MYGQPIPLPQNCVLLRPHWQYHVKRCGIRRSRQCADGPTRSAKILHAIVDSYSACVNQPVQLLFFALSAILNHRLYGGDACDVYTHSPGTYSVPTFVSIDDQYAEWYHDRYKNLPTLHRKHDLPFQKAIQGHPEAGRMWETHINSILFSTELNCCTTTHDRCIYHTTDHNSVQIGRA